MGREENDEFFRRNPGEREGLQRDYGVTTSRAEAAYQTLLQVREDIATLAGLLVRVGEVSEDIYRSLVDALGEIGAHAVIKMTVATSQGFGPGHLAKHLAGAADAGGEWDNSMTTTTRQLDEQVTQVLAILGRVWQLDEIGSANKAKKGGQPK